MTRFQNTIPSPVPVPVPVPVMEEPKDTQQLEIPEIYFINREHANSTRSKKHQSLEHDLYRRCADVDTSTTYGKIEASNGRLANGNFSGELKLVGFPNNNGDFVVNLKCSVAKFYSVRKIAKNLTKKRRLPNAAVIDAVFCNALYFPCYVDIKTIQMKFNGEDFIEFSGNICDTLDLTTIK